MKILFTLLFSLFAVLSFAQTGTIDNSYGTDKTGTVFIRQQTLASTVTTQPDNNLLVGGTDYLGTQFSIMRLSKEGAIDSSFGENAQANTSFNDVVQNLTGISGWRGIAVQADGRIVATGTTTRFSDSAQGDAPRDYDIAVARYMPDGKPDESFGKGGKLITDLGFQETASAIAVQEDGKIVVVGYQARTSNGDGSGILVLRYNADGSLDKTFGAGNGYVKYTKTFSRAYAALLQPDGKIVTGGNAGVNASFILVRFLPDGSVDGSFGDGGQAVTSFTGLGYLSINSIAIDETGRIAAAGYAGAYMAIARYLQNGQPDNSFDEDGQKVLSFKNATNGVANTALLQPDGKLVVVGNIVGGKLSLWTLALTGLNEDGSLDASFANEGTEITNLTFPESTSTHAALQNDGKIIVAGNYYEEDYTKVGFSSTRFLGYPVHVSLAVRIKHYLQNHGITWNGLPAEDKVAYYSVEQSSSRGTGFTPIAKLSGRSNLHDYSFTNAQLLQGTNYYRIKAVSTDGTIRYSEVASADNITNSASVYPNPAKNYVTVQGLPNNETANISIKNGSGTVLSKGVSNGSTQYRSSLANLQPGTYYVNITTTNKTETLKFVKE